MQDEAIDLPNTIDVISCSFVFVSFLIYITDFELLELLDYC